MSQKDQIINAFQDQHAKRSLIPSQEEQGLENNLTPQKKHIPLNPVIGRGQDPELFWLNKYDNDQEITQKFEQIKDAFKNKQIHVLEHLFNDLKNLLVSPKPLPEELILDIRSLYIKELVSPKLIAQQLYSIKEQPQAQDLFTAFNNHVQMDTLDKIENYYKHQDDWANRLILGDSLLAMLSLAEKENLASKVQMIYIDPPYGIKYGSNWQIKINDRNVKDQDDNSLSPQPEQIKAFRDTWELGIHSYLSYLKERFLIAKELLHQSGSIFVQISDENVHLVRCLLDEVFGSENFVSEIIVKTRSTSTANFISSLNDFTIWYAKDKSNLKYKQLFTEKEADYSRFCYFDDNGVTKNINEIPNYERKNYDVFSSSSLNSTTSNFNANQEFEYEGKKYLPAHGRSWRCSVEGLKNLAKKNRILLQGNSIRYKYYYEDFPLIPLSNLWEEQISEQNKMYVVQTGIEAIKRCILMTTDVGDLVLDPTCGSGTTAYVAEQWGRRWISIDTSRIAINIAKTRLMTAVFPYYKLLEKDNLRAGFVYKEVPHITLKSLANNEKADIEKLYDQAEIDTKKLRIAGSFSVEILQSLQTVPPQSFHSVQNQDETEDFFHKIAAGLESSGIRNGNKNEQVVFSQVQKITGEYLHAVGYYQVGEQKKVAYFHIANPYESLSKQTASQAVKEALQKMDCSWVVLLAFSFDETLENKKVAHTNGSFEFTKVRLSDDLLQNGLLKKDKKSASFVSIGEPDIALLAEGKRYLWKNQVWETEEGYLLGKQSSVQIEILGMDIYNPYSFDVNSREKNDIAYWSLDDNYNGSVFILRQFFLCGGEHDEYDKMLKGVEKVANDLKKTLKIEVDTEALERLYGYVSAPIELVKGKKIALRVVSQFGEESSKVISF